MAEVPALHLKSYWGQSLLVTTIFSSSWCRGPKHLTRPGLRASFEDGCRHPAVRRTSLNSGDSPPPSLGRARWGDVLGHCPQARLSWSRPSPWPTGSNSDLPPHRGLPVDHRAVPDPGCWGHGADPDLLTLTLIWTPDLPHHRGACLQIGALGSTWPLLPDNWPSNEEIVSNTHKRHCYAVNSDIMCCCRPIKKKKGTKDWRCRWLVITHPPPGWNYHLQGPEEQGMDEHNARERSGVWGVCV